MRSAKLAAVLAATLTLTACVESESTFNSERQKMAADPVLKRQVIDYCVQHANTRRRVDREMIAALMKVPLNRTGIAFCQRAINAMVSGRLSYADYKIVMEGGQGDMSRVIAILQGR